MAHTYVILSAVVQDGNVLVQGTVDGTAVSVVVPHDDLVPLTPAQKIVFITRSMLRHVPISDPDLIGTFTI
jgi:hypothetical protein